MRAVFRDSPVYTFAGLNLEHATEKCIHTPIHTYDDKYCADVIRPFLMLGENLNITNGRSSDIEQMLWTIAAA